MFRLRFNRNLKLAIKMVISNRKSSHNRHFELAEFELELPFRIKFSLNRKLSGYEFQAIYKWHNVGKYLRSSI
jgi:hypothetical protein